MKKSSTHELKETVSPVVADPRDVAGRIERARQQLPAATPERELTDSRWPNWYSR